MTPDMLALGLLWYVVFLFSTTCHEAAHALAGKWGGDLTAFNGGQVTLNPLPHLRREPFGMAVVPILSFLTGGWMIGWASAPYDPAWSERHPHRAARMALAGPAANFLLALVAALLIHLGMWIGVFQLPESARFVRMVDPTAPGIAEGFAHFLSLLLSLNVLLGVFNLLPIPPLDGFNAIGLLLSEKKARRFGQIGKTIRSFAFMGLLVSWRLFDNLYSPLFALVLKLLYPGAHYAS